MNRTTIVYLLVILFTFGACSAKPANTQSLAPNNQELNRNKELRDINDIPAKTSIQKELQDGQSDVNSIKNAKGLLVLNNSRPNKKDFIRFFNEDGSLWYKFTFYYEDNNGNFEENEDFAPFAFHQDNFLLALKCIGEDQSRYEVIVNEETGLKKFVQKDDPTLKLETWEEHIAKAFAIDFNRKENPLRESPEGKVKKVDLPEEVTFHPDNIRGEWLKVHWSGSEKSRKNGEFGWIKWKENHKLLIELFYFS